MNNSSGKKRLHFSEFPFIKNGIQWAKQTILPGFDGVPLYHALLLSLKRLYKLSILDSLNIRIHLYLMLMLMSKIQYCYRLEQLARLGLPSQIFIPALLQELHYDIPSLSNTFCWQNNEGKLSNIYDETHNTNVSTKFITSISSDKHDKHSHTTNWVSQLDQLTTSF